MPHETGFNAAENPYTESEFLKIYEDYRVPNDPMKYQDEKFYWTYQRGVHWPRLNDPVDFRKISGFHRCGSIQNRALGLMDI